MFSKVKFRIMCGLTSTVVLLGSLVPAIAVKADDGPTEGQMLVYENDRANFEYSMEQAYQKAEDERQYQDDGWWYWDQCWKKPKPERHAQRCDYVTLDIGDTYSVAGVGVRYWSDNPNVASVDGNGKVTANNDGNCRIYTAFYDGNLYSVTVITVRKREKKDNNNVVYTPVYTPVYTVPAATNVNAAWLAIATNLVATAPQRGTVNLSSLVPMSFDSSFVNVLKLRPDVTLNVTFGYNGHTFLLTIPAGYNLSSKLNAYGTVDFLTLSNVTDGKIMCRLLY